MSGVAPKESGATRSTRRRDKRLGWTPTSSCSGTCMGRKRGRCERWSMDEHELSCSARDPVNRGGGVNEREILILVGPACSEQEDLPS